MGTHDFDALRFVLEREIVEVAAMTAAQGLASPGIEDGVMATLRFDDGMLASFHAAYNVGFGGSAFDVHGSKGSLLGRMVLTPTGGGELVLRTAGGDREVDLGPAAVAYDGTVAAFMRAVRGEGSPAATGLDGLRSLAVAAAVRESAASGRAVTVATPAAQLAAGSG
jgi:1,5-anhydro-D-fructose reductase (1,5-anhydro-D-mannitol-forming)